MGICVQVGDTESFKVARKNISLWFRSKISNHILDAPSLANCDTVAYIAGTWQHLTVHPDLQTFLLKAASQTQHKWVLEKCADCKP